MSQYVYGINGFDPKLGEDPDKKKEPAWWEKSLEYLTARQRRQEAEARARAGLPPLAAPTGLQRYMPYLLVGGAALAVIMLLRKD